MDVHLALFGDASFMLGSFSVQAKHPTLRNIHFVALGNEQTLMFGH